MVEESVRDYLLADSTLMGLITDVVTFNDTGRNGIGLIDTPSLFVNGLLQPCALVKLRSIGAMDNLRDAAEKVTAARGVVEIWLYDDGDTGYDTILVAQERVYELLTSHFIAGAGWFRWYTDLHNLRDSSLDEAAVIRSDYTLTRVRGN